jgi:hypothetical protein
MVELIPHCNVIVIYIALSRYLVVPQKASIAWSMEWLYRACRRGQNSALRLHDCTLGTGDSKRENKSEAANRSNPGNEIFGMRYSLETLGNQGT